MPITRRARLALAAVALLASVACSHLQDHTLSNGNANSAQPAANTNGTNASAANANVKANAATKSKPGTGSIEITSVPAGAGITMMPTSEDSAGEPLAYGPTPATINDLAPGKYTVHLHQTGYKEFRREVEIKAGSAVRVNATLKK
ncbi:MAG: PEGA domain-containing protein [Blastocatellia bacterium]